MVDEFGAPPGNDQLRVEPLVDLSLKVTIFPGQTATASAVKLAIGVPVQLERHPRDAMCALMSDLDTADQVEVLLIAGAMM